MSATVLYYDLGSPYAYLSLSRVPAVLGLEPQLQPVLLGALFARRGSGSWSQTPERETRVAEIEQRAQSYGLPPLRWPPAWPANGLLAMRCATWAQQQGRGAAFANAVFKRQFAEGADIAELDVLLGCARDAGLDADQLTRCSQQEPVKDALRLATERAWEEGVRGIPTVRVGAELFYGDDRLELAARALKDRNTGTAPG
jgi:2-hydroxychromene-2-carboxylate isomerase